MAGSTCQPFQEGAPLQHGGGCVLPPPAYRGGMALRKEASSSASLPAAAPERSPLSGRSATEARALKIHSEAERRRRERINAHLATLRTMIPDTKQMDKATLLASAIDQLRDLKRKASEATQTQPTPVPAEADSVTVNCHTGGDARATVYIHASVSCDDRPGLLADVAAAVRGLGLRAVRAKMEFLGGRARCGFVLWREGGGVSLVVKRLEEDVRRALARAAFSDVGRGWCGSSSRSKRRRVLESRRTA